MNQECEMCGGACCKKSWNIVFPEDENVPRQFTTTGHRMIGGTMLGERMMKKREDNSCVCLLAGTCSIYERRPSVCREFTLNDEACIEARSEKGIE